MSSMISTAGVPASIGESLRSVTIVRVTMNNGVNQGRANTTAVCDQPDVVLHQSLTVRWGGVGWPLALGDSVDHVNDDKGTFLWFQPEWLGHGIPPCNVRALACLGHLSARGGVGQGHCVPHV